MANSCDFFTVSRTENHSMTSGYILLLYQGLSALPLFPRNHMGVSLSNRIDDQTPVALIQPGY